MGYKNKAYRKSLHDQAYEVLQEKLSPDQSKHRDREQGITADKVYSYSTYKTYHRQINLFCRYMKELHPEITTLKKARPYIQEWLDQGVQKGESAWTIQTKAKALGKLYGITPQDKDYYHPPVRHRADAKRSRGDAKRDRHFSESNNAELVYFCKGTGLRRSEIRNLKGGMVVSREQLKRARHDLEKKPTLDNRDSHRWQLIRDALIVPNVEYYVVVKGGKGGRDRLAPVIGSKASQIVARIKNTPSDKKVWEHVSGNADIHGYRAEYATKLYKLNARDISQIPYNRLHNGTGKMYQSDVYFCRKDEKGRKLDKKAMQICSKALGHNRICVVSESYLRGL